MIVRQLGPYTGRGARTNDHRGQDPCLYAGRECEHAGAGRILTPLLEDVWLGSPPRKAASAIVKFAIGPIL